MLSSKGAVFLLLFIASLIAGYSFPLRCQAKSLTVGFIASGTAIDDDSFNGMTISGLRKLQREHSLHIEVSSGGFNYADIQKGLESLIKKNCNVIVVNSSTSQNEVVKYAAEHPEIYFIINDAQVDGYKNISSISFGQCMGSYLVGALCGWQSRTGKVGFIGGNEHPVILDFLCGFKQGVKLSGNKVGIEVKFIRSGVSKQGFEDPHQANILAKRMYDSGVDIIYSVAGLSGNGVIQAARKSGNFVVGVDSDQDAIAKGTILTSMMKRLDVAVFEEVMSILEGKFVSGAKIYDLSNGGVGLTEMKYSKHLISADILQKLEDLRAKLASGEIRLECSVN